MGSLACFRTQVGLQEQERFDYRFAGRLMWELDIGSFLGGSAEWASGGIGHKEIGRLDLCDVRGRKSAGERERVGWWTGRKDLWSHDKDAVCCRAAYKHDKEAVG
mmetsp:Transcript_12363/g.24614  ORF Transcript_12363/g.24614 Transcript_12363/m.24614 type:complete len:105 (-) Transcript_12363:101-415(-)